jgi:hypothetical protein
MHQGRRSPDPVQAGSPKGKRTHVSEDERHKRGAFLPEPKQGQCTIQTDDSVAYGLEIAGVLPSPTAQIEKDRAFGQQRQPLN